MSEGQAAAGAIPAAAGGNGVGRVLIAQEQTVRWMGWLSVVALTALGLAVLWKAPELAQLKSESLTIIVGIISSIVTCLTTAVGTVIGVKAALSPTSAPKVP